MRRLPALAFAALVAATIGAFFITQHLKVSDPLMAGFRLAPASINPQHGRVCSLGGVPTSFRRSRISFYLPDHSDTTGVLVINDAGVVVRQFAWRKLRRGQRGFFVWHGREQNGAYAPAGDYYVEVVLQKEGRTFQASERPLRIVTTPPRPRVTRVRVNGSAAGSDSGSAVGSVSGSAAGSVSGSAAGSERTGARPGVVISPPHGTVTIHFRPRHYRYAKIIVYRSAGDGRLRPVRSFRAGARHGVATWNGTIDGQPAPAGVYLIGVQVADAACNLGSFPTVPRPTASTIGSGVTVSYLSVQPQLYPVRAGSQATVYVDSHGAPYTWILHQPGQAGSLARGTVAAGRSGSLDVRVPGSAAGLDLITVKSAGRKRSVPVVVSAVHGPRVLVVLPALSWQGANPVDDNGDGLPDTLERSGDTIALNRPLADGLPSGFADEAALLRYLQKLHMRYQLTTDVALAQGTGPPLRGRSGVILDGPFTWIPSKLATELRGYVSAGGEVLSLGVDSLQAQAPVKPGTTQSGTGPTAGPAVGLPADPFGAHHGTVQPLGNAILTTFADPLRIFGAAAAFTGYTTYQPIAPPTGTNVSLAGVAAQAPAVTGFRLGKGEVVEVGLSGFGTNLHRDDASRELLSAVWKHFTRR